MMGLGSTGSDTFGSLFEMLGLLGDKDKYEGKLKELVAAAETSKRTLEQAAENNRKAEETQKIAQEMLTAANMKVEDANARVNDAVKLNEAAAQKERAAQVKEASLERTRTEMNVEFAARRDALDKEMKEHQADLERRNANFIAEQQAIASKIEARWHEATNKEVALNKREEHLVRLIAENEDTRTKLAEQKHELLEKLSRLKAIAGA